MHQMYHLRSFLNSIAITHMSFLELLHILLRNFLQIIDTKNQTQPQFKFHLAFAILELKLSDSCDIKIIIDDSLHKLLIIFVWPVESLLGVEVRMVERKVFAANLGARKCSSHLLCIGFVVDLRGFHYLLVIIEIPDSTTKPTKHVNNFNDKKEWRSMKYDEQLYNKNKIIINGMQWVQPSSWAFATFGPVR